jgi:hypothetical protein
MARRQSNGGLITRRAALAGAAAAAAYGAAGAGSAIAEPANGHRRSKPAPGFVDPTAKLVMVQTALENHDEVWRLWAALVAQFA